MAFYALIIICIFRTPGLQDLVPFTKIKTYWMKRLAFKLPGLFLLLFLAGCMNNRIKVTEIQNGAILESRQINVKLQFYSPNEVRITKWLPGTDAEKKSLSVIKTELPDIDILVKQDEGGIIVTSDRLSMSINKKSGAVNYFTPEGKQLLAEGSSEFEPMVYAEDSGYSVTQNLILTPTEGIYGLGQHQYGYMNYRGKLVKLVQTNTDAVNPFLISTQGYGILWDNYSKTIYQDDGVRNASLYSDLGDNIDYYFICGENMNEVIAGYRDLTGQAPMYGKWAYGYWQSKEHYDTQDELMGVATKYRKLGIPIDNMIQDWDYWNGAENWSGMFFDKDLFPRPKEMVDRLHAMNFHIIISIWPALGPNTEIYADMDRNGFLYSPVGWAGFKYYDAFNPAANALYWKYLKKGLYSVGLDGWWIDSTEPDVVNALTKESTEYEMKKVGRNYLGSWARYLNAFSLVMADDIYRNWRAETHDRRAYILTRSTYAGQQRNAVTTWSGDIGASWEVYKKQIAAGLNHSMSGIPYWTFDIGAFVIGAYDGIFSEGGKDPAYQELYARMFQLGVFTPIFRSHGSETPREIWEFGEYVPTLIKFDNLRYRLMPYIYSLAWKVTSESYTIMRGLPMDFAGDENCYDIDDQFMFGPSLMPCPVTEYMYHRPPEQSIPVSSSHFKNDKGEQGLTARYYKDDDYQVLGKEKTDKEINIFWYTGRPEYVTDSMFSIRWEGKLIPDETGLHQFHLKSFDAKRIILNGDTLKMVYTSVEQYTELVDLEAGKEYNFILETENRSTGAARMQLFWKTPSILEMEKTDEERPETRNVYLPIGTGWYDFWTGKKYEGGQELTSAAPMAIIPLYVKTGSILPLGPFLQYSTEKPADPLELRIYPGAEGTFTLYEDENDNYNYEKGVYATIDFHWNDKERTLTIDDWEGEYPGIMKERSIHVILVDEDHGTGIGICSSPDKILRYTGKKEMIKFK
jgi:alpha-D-xyloside xylohydrolase